MRFDACNVLFCSVFTVISVRLQGQNTRPPPEVTEKVISLARQWAPSLWIHPQDTFLPSSVDDYLNEVFVKSLNCPHCMYNASELPTGPSSTNYYLVTKTHKDKLLWNHTSILYGSNILSDNVPAYAFVSTCDPSYNTYIVTYWFFYPFNEGKEICSVKLGNSKALPVLKLFKKCLAKTVKYGSHIGDWEHMSLKFKNFVPSRMFLSVHNIGMYYKYNQANNQFYISSGLTQGLTMVQNPPSAVKVVNGHPVIFAAKGSHGLWGAAGTFKYTKLSLNQLADATGYGTPWKTWKELQVYFPSNIPHWYYFQGRWGNPKRDCLVVNQFFRSNICIFSDGPVGLSQRKPNFLCK